MFKNTANLIDEIYVIILICSFLLIIELDTTHFLLNYLSFVSDLQDALCT